MHDPSLDRVIHQLDEVIERALRERSRIGYFAALYRHVAARLRACVAEGMFEHPAFIVALNQAFLARYLDALDQYRRGELPPKAWLVAFEAAQSSAPTVDQHLILGINAHINLDLGVAVARAAQGAYLPHLKADFDRMTAVLIELFDAVMKNLGAVSPLLGRLDAVAGAPKDALVHFGMDRARQHAWNVAVRLSAMPGQAERVAEVARLDDFVAGLGRLVASPAPLAAVFRAQERGSVEQVIALLLAGGHGRSQPRPGGAPAERPAQVTRVAILGGGAAALAAAFELTDPHSNPDHASYEVTLYQMGWRLGGKGASGRSLRPDEHLRIEEHGLHAWFGFYENGFELMRRCYAELGRPAGHPLATVEQAFIPLNCSALIDSVGGRHAVWPILTPPNPERPGEGAALLPLRDYVAMALRLLHTHYRDSDHAREQRPAGPGAGGPGVIPAPLRPLIGALSGGGGAEAAPEGVQALFAAARLFEWAGHAPDEVIRWFGGAPFPLADLLGQSADSFLHRLRQDLHAQVGRLVLDLLGAFMAWLWGEIGAAAGERLDRYRTWIAANFIYANVRGALADDLLTNGLASINDHDYREWLALHAFPDGGLMCGSELVSAVYDSSFAYLDGKASFEAGTALQGLVRAVFTYKGAFGYKMAAATGDTIFAPLYEVLRRRGVRFEFFHRVKELRLQHDAPGRPVGAVVLSRQARLREGADAYAPLIDVKGLPCWPSEPLYEQLADGAALRASGVDLEQEDPAGAEELTLALGADFDKVILGISIAALPPICRELTSHSKRWRDSLSRVRTTPTQALQLWLRPSAADLGWPEAFEPIMSFTYPARRQPDALNAWGDMSHLIDREDWPAAHYPLSIAYFCSALDIRNDPQPGYEQRYRQEVYAAAQRFLNRQVHTLWPRAVTGGPHSHFDWGALLDARPGAPAGEDRLRSQYWRANVTPTERYVLSVPGSSRYRLAAHCPEEFPNLYLAGDWTANGLNCGCMEAAIISGRLASLALCGYPRRHAIVGLDFG